ncbi:MAG: hypothetical protein LBF91_04365 [Azoarcus sp.]|nr:hypothetical protein [Azoarcus sp.]
MSLKAVCMPKALLGLASIGIGLAIIAWVVYNSFVERLPQYSGGFLTFGIGTTLLLFGWAWLVSAFRGKPDASDGTLPSSFDNPDCEA